MSNLWDTLYYYWVGLPSPEKWKDMEYTNDTDTHSRYAFRKGLRLGMALAQAVGEEDA